MKKPSVSSLEGTFLRESLGAMVDGSFEIRRSPVDIPQDPWDWSIYLHDFGEAWPHEKGEMAW